MYLPLRMMSLITTSSSLSLLLGRQVAAFTTFSTTRSSSSTRSSILKSRESVVSWIAVGSACLRRATEDRLQQPRTRSVSSPSMEAQAPHSTLTSAEDTLVFDFETVHDRSNTGAVKWDVFGGKDVVPMWVADMEFQTAPVVRAALHTRIEHGIFGYTNPTAGATDAVVRYYKVGYSQIS